jgi:hypothetical protein
MEISPVDHLFGRYKKILNACRKKIWGPPFVPKNQGPPAINRRALEQLTLEMVA